MGNTKYIYVLQKWYLSRKDWLHYWDDTNKAKVKGLKKRSEKEYPNEKFRIIKRTTECIITEEIIEYENRR